MRILLWHVHGGWTDAFVQGNHEYLMPTNPERDAWGLGTAGRDWPDSVLEVPPEDLATADVDVVILQRLEEFDECERLLGRRPGRDIPALFLEHNTPKGDVPASVHPLADQSDIPVVHVTHFNELMWDCGRAPTIVVEHGIVDPGYLYTGRSADLGVVVNEPVRRWRVTGTDLLPRFARTAPLRVYGMGTDKLASELALGPDELTIGGDLAPKQLHAALAESRAYLHPIRWTSLGLALLEAMHLGMPVIALATTEAMRAVPPEAGAISTNVDELCRAAGRLMNDPEEARIRGKVARETVLERFSLGAFLSSWDNVLSDTQARSPAAAATTRRLT